MKTEKKIYYPQCMRIKARKINVLRSKDGGYQRNAQAGKVDKICADYNMYLVNPVKVYKRNNDYYAFDGQNTLTALIKLFGENCEVPSLVYNINDQQASELFELQTGYSTRPTSRDKFKSRVFRADEDTELIIHICEEYGFVVVPSSNFHNKGSKGTNLRCVAELDKAYKKLGKLNFEKVIRMLRYSWSGEPYGNDKNLVIAMAQFVELFGDTVEENYAIKKFSRVTANLMVKTIKEHKEWKGNRYVNALIVEYNKGLSEKNKLAMQ